MPLRTSTPIGAPCWIDLFSSDPDKSQAFYGSLFGWTAESAGEDFGGYINFSKNGHRVAGGMKNDGQSGMPDTWSVYLATANAEATANASTAHGGQVLVPAMAVADLGSMAVLVDASQAVIGTWQPGLHRGFELTNEPGAPVWFELHTRDYEAAVGFYRDVFGWDSKVMSDTPELRYSTLGEGDDALAGIMDAGATLAEGVPPTWQVYFAVEDTDAAVAKIVELGGSVESGPDDTPYGRLAAATDPTGAHFRIVASPTATQDSPA